MGRFHRGGNVASTGAAGGSNLTRTDAASGADLKSTGAAGGANPKSTGAPGGANLRSTGAPGGALVAIALALLVALVLAAPEAAAQGMRKPRLARGGAKKTRTVVVLESLEDGRRYATIVDRKRPALDRLDGTLRSSTSEAQVAAFLENGELCLVDERVDYGDAGGSARNRYYVSNGRLVYYESLQVRPRDVGDGRRPARDEVLTSLAFGEDGALVGSEKTVNREPIALAPTEEPRVRQRFAALAAKVAESLEAER